MKYVLIKYKNIKMLINESEVIQPLIENLSDIEKLDKDVNEFYLNPLLNTTKDAKKLDEEKDAIRKKIGYSIIGVPFTNQDAELYAIDKKLDYEVLELHGNVGKHNAKKDNSKESQVQMRVTQRQKATWVKQALKNNLKLSEWITKKLNDEL